MVERDKFLRDYKPDAQSVLCDDRDLCFFGEFPTIAKIGARWGRSTASAWLVPQLANLSEFCGCKNKISPEQLKECAMLIAQNYFFLKVTELMLFFNRFKQGRYGHFYGSVDPLVIMTALQDFMRERNDAIFDHESELNRRRMEARKGQGITYDEYLRRKEQKENNQTK